ncbi:MAG: response regulator transcription factor [Lachnospiraceae bacterium]|nr:response regulator transcription factor [Lachnospiraceae bacterium]
MQEILRIGICDDEKVIHDLMKQLIHTYCEKNNITVQVSSYMSGTELLDSQDIINLDTLFLDIDMPKIDGIETAFQLNNNKVACKTIMLTSKTERFKEAFKIGAFRFVTKPIEQKEVFEAIDDVRVRMLGTNLLSVYRDGKECFVMEKDIAYIMLDKTSAYVYTEKYEFRSDESLAWWEEKLDQRLFVRCHKGCIVNVSKIVDVDKKNIVLVTGERCPIARRRAKEVEQRWMEYDTKYR